MRTKSKHNRHHRIAINSMKK